MRARHGQPRRVRSATLHRAHIRCHACGRSAHPVSTIGSIAVGGAVGLLSAITVDDLDQAVRPEQIVGGYRERMDALVQAVLAVSSGLALDATLRRIVEAAVDLVDARYGALAVLGEAGVFEQFVHVGVDDADR